jgi:hypothetical protein
VRVFTFEDAVCAPGPLTRAHFIPPLQNKKKSEKSEFLLHKDTTRKEQKVKGMRGVLMLLLFFTEHS